MQTRPGDDEPENESEREPFTPKVKPSAEDEEREGSEPEAQEPEEPAAESGGKDRHKHRGQMSAETLKPPSAAQESADDADADADADADGDGDGEAEPAERAGEPESSETGGASETDRPEKPAESESTAEPESAAEAGEPEERPRPELAETVNLKELLPEEPSAEAAEPEKRPEPDLAETVNLRDLLPESSEQEATEQEGPEQEATEQEGPEQEGPEQEGPELPLRRRAPAEGEPPRRRPAPGGQPPRRPGPGPDPRRGPYTGDPRRRPPSEHPDHPGVRRPGPPPRPAAAAASAPSAPPVKPVSVSLGRRRLFAALWPPRLSRNQAVVGVLLAALGAALAIQVRATNTSDQILRGARADDLVNILDEVTSRGQSLDAELRTLETQNAAIRDSADKGQAALAQAQAKAKDLQILAGTVKARGPGITMTVTDPQGQLKSATLLNALEELRAAGAEVVQVDDVRVVVSSYFVDTADGGIALDGHELAQPYVYKVIGDPNTLGPAMQIPGGVVATVKSSPGANVTITPGQILVDAVAPLPSPDFAKAG